VKSVVLRHEFTVPAPPDVVVSHLMEPAAYVGLNGLVIAVRDIRSDGDAIAYTAVERLPFLGLHYHNDLKVRVHTEEGGTRFVMEVDTRGGVRVRITTDVTPAAGGSLAADSITLTAPALMRGYATRQARAGQLQRARTLAARMGATAAGPGES
jgi:hypothetical protein